MSMDPCAEPALLTVEAMQQKLLQTLSPLPAANVPIADSLGRVLAEEIRASVVNPRFDNSAMDGFALGGEATAAAPGTFPLVGTRLAGSEDLAELAPGAAMRITTGAPVPEGTATVVMQEHCSVTDDSVTLRDAVKAGQNIRRRGEDIQLGQCLLEAGTRVAPRHIMLLSSQGLETLQVTRQPVVAVLSSGDELHPVGQPLSRSGIYDCNRPYLLARLQQAGARVIDIGIVADDPQQIRDALLRAANEADLIVSSGGVSVGQADWLKRCVEELGTLLHWKVNIKPGKPVAWGRIGAVPFLGLPGNPVSTLVCAELFLLPALARLGGVAQPLPRVVRLPIAHDHKHKPGRDEYQRAALVAGAESLQVAVLKGQGSGSLANLARTDALLLLGADVTSVAAGMLVDVLVL
ncbi:gephyrin-like molybdotransferase Glp [Azomonas macrocytogenes]|uniref:Molybdopterin molybdenumtransferase n=1 Tax=Azomonas macrocytogenes TaxID=69962 RepID=A0A839SX73_AZOMA|nr:gephyrin-like molybdotransferase Glp [Azomonas macrocytogenes]MBB3101971.1 molybdopterin molybdotransferase [Azomonas macrocytogenes]